MASNDMTGKLVLGFGGITDMEPCIYRDNGHYDGTLAKLNVRKVELVELFSDLNPMDAASSTHNDKYGCRWGGGANGLFPVTTETIDALRRLNAKKRVAREAAEKQLAVEAAAHAKLLAESGLCPKCGTWCFGDCQEAR